MYDEHNKKKNICFRLSVCSADPKGKVNVHQIEREYKNSPATPKEKEKQVIQKTIIRIIA